MIFWLMIQLFSITSVFLFFNLNLYLSMASKIELNKKSVFSNFLDSKIDGEELKKIIGGFDEEQDPGAGEGPNPCPLTVAACWRVRDRYNAKSNGNGAWVCCS